MKIAQIGTAEWRKQRPVKSGVLDYFPDAILEVAFCSWVGNEQHNPGEHLHWAKHKSTDELDALSRHMLEAGTFDTDAVRHSAKIAWRALANLQRELDAEKQEFAEEAFEGYDEELGITTPDISWGPNKDLHEEERERRMNIIGQNGNDGLHYDDASDIPGSIAWDLKEIEKENTTTSTGMYPGGINITYDEPKS